MHSLPFIPRAPSTIIQQGFRGLSGIWFSVDPRSLPSVATWASLPSVDHGGRAPDRVFYVHPEVASSTIHLPVHIRLRSRKIIQLITLVFPSFLLVEDFPASSMTRWAELDAHAKFCELKVKGAYDSHTTLTT